MKKIAVLIVDDSEADRYLLSRELAETGLDVKIFEETDGKGALTFFKNYNENLAKFSGHFPPLIVFLDINMPLVSGFEFLEEFNNIRNEFHIETSFIMMFSSSERKKDREQAFSYSFVKAYLTKGKFSSDQLEEEIIKVCDER